MAQQEKATAAPEMPPAMAEIKKQSAEEVMAEMNRMPLFMTTLDETDGEGGENPLLEAMKALAYEGTRYEVAENFRQQGNECARAKQWNDAKEFYDKAIAALKGPQRRPDPEANAAGGQVIEVELDEEEEAKKEKVVEEASYVNRALCNLEKSKSPTSGNSLQASFASKAKSPEMRPCSNARVVPERASGQPLRCRNIAARRLEMAASTVHEIERPQNNEQSASSLPPRSLSLGSYFRVCSLPTVVQFHIFAMSLIMATYRQSIELLSCFTGQTPC